MPRCAVGPALFALASLAALACAGASSPSSSRILRKRSCLIGLNSHHCELSKLDAAMRSREQLLRGFGPGKRAAFVPEDLLALASKRSCRLRLGGLCLTESLDRAASQLYYLQSPTSPGRRRRRHSPAQQRPLSQPQQQENRKSAPQRHLPGLARAATRSARR